MNLAFGKQVPAVVQPVGPVVVAAHRKHRQPGLGQPGEKPVQQGDGPAAGNGLVVQVTGQQHGVHGFLSGQREGLFKHMALVRQQVKLIQPLAQVQVGQMQKFHEKHLLESKGQHPPLGDDALGGQVQRIGGQVGGKQRFGAQHSPIRPRAAGQPAVVIAAAVA